MNGKLVVTLCGIGACGALITVLIQPEAIAPSASAASIAAISAIPAFDPPDVAVTLHRLGLDPEALAAAGLSPSAASQVVSTIEAELLLNPNALPAADAAFAETRTNCDALERLIRSGRGTDGDVQTYQAAAQDLNADTGQREMVLGELFALAVTDLTPTQAATLATIRENRHWKRSMEYLVVNRTEPEWVALRDALANERISAEFGTDADPEAQTLLQQARGHAGVIAASANLELNLEAVRAAWEGALEED